MAHVIGPGWLCRCLTTIACVSVTVSCLPRARINNACRWTDDAATLAPPADPSRRKHLIEDVRIANDLGIRYADATAGRMNTPAWHEAQTECTGRSMAEIMRRHCASWVEIVAVAGARELWIDMLAVFLPITLLFLAASHRVVSGIAAGYAREDRYVAAAVLAGIAPLAAGVAVGATQIWGVVVEQLRVRNEHISFRAFDPPASRHGWIVWGFAMALYVLVVTVQRRRMGESMPTSRRATRRPTR